MLLKMKAEIMRYFNKLPIIKKITIVYTVVLSLILLAASLIIVVMATAGLNYAAKIEMSETLASIAAYIEGGGEVTFQAIMEENSNPFVDVVIADDKTGAVIVSLISPRPKLPHDGVEKRFFIRKRAEAMKSWHDDASRLLVDAKKAAYGDSRYTINVYRRMARDRFYIWGLLWIFAVANIIGFITSYFSGKYLSARIINPIKQITETARYISASDLTGRIPDTGPDDELKLLAVTFNDMIDRLKASFDKQTAFVSDASHELKTPISVIQGYANLLSRWGKDDPEILQEAVDSIKNETDHMAMLVKKLLFLSKGDQNAVNAHFSLVILNEIIGEVKKEFDICYPERRLIIMEGEQEAITADYDLIKQLIWAFVDNAVKYSKDDSEVTIKIYEKEGKTAFMVEDKGVGLDDSERPYIFDRFYRADKSRSKAVQGTGLGLSIARLIIDMHKAKVSVYSKPGEGTCIEVWFSGYSRTTLKNPIL